MWDAELVMSENQAETTYGSGGAHDSTNVIDLGAGVDAFGAAKIRDISGMWLNVVITEAVTSNGNATVAFDLQESDDNSSFATSGHSKAATAKATLVKGYEVLRVPIKRGHKRYLKMVYTIGTADLTAGKWSAWISEGPAEKRS